MNKILQKLNLPNVKYDELEENSRFCLFILFIVAPLSLLLTFYEVWAYPFMLFLLLYRAVLPKLVRY